MPTANFGVEYVNPAGCRLGADVKELINVVIRLLSAFN
jgi:hypothetical protein